jgi:rhamnopyranosyl-N-acetylglucosaminyl-diphospho-decaprenol beta-1,3/1,4-galactofuranosyltransferase
MESGVDEGTSEPRVAAVVLTHNRSALLRETLCSLHAQTRPVDEIVVVDNASTDGTAEMLATDFPHVCHLRLPENTGPAGGMAAGLRAVATKGHHWAWLFGDDDEAHPEALEVLLGAVAELAANRLGMLASWMRNERGEPMTSAAGWRHRTMPVPTEGLGGPAHPADTICMSGALISSALIDSVGVPEERFFIMFEEVEYCLRARSAGWEIFVLPRVLITALHQGSAQNGSPWRSYYQTRNHLAMVLQRRSLLELWWWAVRQAKYAVVILTSQDRKRERLAIRLRGAWHGLRGVDGRTVEPGAWGVAGLGGQRQLRSGTTAPR